MTNTLALHQAAYNLAPGMVAYAEDSYESIRWRCADPPSKKDVEEEAKRIAIEIAYAEIRAERNAKLVATDWTQLRDVPVDMKAWEAYRRALRDLPATIADPTEPIDWPEPPK